MKKILTLCLVVLTAVTTVKAQHEIGGIVGGLNGVSYKYWLNGNMALQADLAVGLTAAPTGCYYKGTNMWGGNAQVDHFDFMLNPNFLYHFDLISDLKLYTGGGVGLGLMGGFNGGGVIGKFVANAVVGLAYEISSAPVVLAFDFRPGYGLGFEDASYPHYSMFDWKLGFAVRYKL